MLYRFFNCDDDISGRICDSKTETLSGDIRTTTSSCAGELKDTSFSYICSITSFMMSGLSSSVSSSKDSLLFGLLLMCS